MIGRINALPVEVEPGEREVWTWEVGQPASGRIGSRPEIGAPPAGLTIVQITDAGRRVYVAINGVVGTVTESLPNPAAVRKAEREIGEFRKYQTLHQDFIEVNAQICEMRPAEPDPQSQQEKKRSKPSSRKPKAK